MLGCRPCMFPARFVQSPHDFHFSYIYYNTTDRLLDAFSPRSHPFGWSRVPGPGADLGQLYIHLDLAIDVYSEAHSSPRHFPGGWSKNHKIARGK